MTSRKKSEPESESDATALLKEIAKQAPQLGLNFSSLAGLLRNPAVLSLLVGLIGDRVLEPLLERLTGKSTKPVDEREEEEDEELTDPPVGGGRPVGTENPSTARRIAGVRAVHYMGAARKHQPYKEGGGRFSIDKDEFRSLMSQQSGCQAGDRFAGNMTPFDQFGKDFLPGEDANKLLLVRGMIEEHQDAGYGPGLYPAWEWVTSGDCEVTNEYDDYGCTPQILVPWKDPKIRPGYRGAFSVKANLYVKDGRAVKPGDPHDNVFVAQFPEVLVTPWGHPSLK